MPGATRVLGPWSKGLNLTSNRDLSVFLRPDELGEATNVVLTQEGYIAPRPGCKAYVSDTLYANITVDSIISIVGNVKLSTNETAVIVQVRNPGVTYLYKITDGDSCTLYYTDNTGTNFTSLLIHSGFVADANGYIKDTGIIFFSEENERTHISYSLDLSQPPTLISSTYKIPGSHFSFIVKDRLFLFNRVTSKMHWSPALYILDFRGSEYTGGPQGNDYARSEPIEPSVDQDGIFSVEFYNNNFYIFKKYKTFMFTYQTTPYEDGYMRKISNEMGAFDSTLFRGKIVVINNKGVFRVEGTEFLDLQRSLNLRFEIPLDHTNIEYDDIFITDFNENIMFGYRDKYTDPNNPKDYYFALNGNNGGWTRWDFTYTDNIAAPGTRQYLCQESLSTKQLMLSVSFDKKSLLYMDWKPAEDIHDYHLDGDVRAKTTADLVTYGGRYIPRVTIKTMAAVGDDMLAYTKLYRSYLRFYLSDQERIEGVDTAYWSLSINYNDYRFKIDTSIDDNPIYYLYPTKGTTSPAPVMLAVVDEETAIYNKAYQLPIGQQRVREFVFELKRDFNLIPSDTRLVNTDVDRPIKQGYYFLLSAIWFDYMDKVRI